MYADNGLWLAPKDTQQEKTMETKKDQQKRPNPDKEQHIYSQPCAHVAGPPVSGRLVMKSWQASFLGTMSSRSPEQPEEGKTKRRKQRTIGPPHQGPETEDISGVAKDNAQHCRGTGTGIAADFSLETTDVPREQLLQVLRIPYPWKRTAKRQQDKAPQAQGVQQQRGSWVLTKERDSLDVP